MQIHTPKETNNEIEAEGNKFSIVSDVAVEESISFLRAELKNFSQLH